MQNLNEARRSRMLMLLFFACIAFAVCLLVAHPAYASEIWAGTGEGGASGKPWDMKEYGQKIVTMYSIVKAIAAPFAAASVAVSALEVLFGSEREQGKALSRLKYTVIALACLYLLPIFISMGYNAVKNIQWDPTNPDFNW